MPYRVQEIREPCEVCELLTAQRCRRCGTFVCDEHSVRFAFYVPTAQCSDRDTCNEIVHKKRVGRGRTAASLRRKIARDLGGFFGPNGIKG